ncbi:MAG TPA: hypothetical protein VFQ44_19550 [Streptosporangiaceae bacterium]|nr:hypothetical protein [Streptosporangiaceae bacterium]
MRTTHAQQRSAFTLPGGDRPLIDAFLLGDKMAQYLTSTGPEREVSAR